MLVSFLKIFGRAICLYGHDFDICNIGNSATSFLLANIQRCVVKYFFRYRRLGRGKCLRTQLVGLKSFLILFSTNSSKQRRNPSGNSIVELH